MSTRPHRAEWEISDDGAEAVIVQRCRDGRWRVSRVRVDSDEPRAAYEYIDDTQAAELLLQSDEIENLDGTGLEEYDVDTLDD